MFKFDDAIKLIEATGKQMFSLMIAAVLTLAFPTEWLAKIGIKNTLVLDIAKTAAVFYIPFAIMMLLIAVFYEPWQKQNAVRKKLLDLSESEKQIMRCFVAGKNKTIHVSDGFMSPNIYVLIDSELIKQSGPPDEYKGLNFQCEPIAWKLIQHDPEVLKGETDRHAYY